jgi:hypothetical protein
MGDRMIHAHECAVVIGIDGGGTQMGKTGAHWMCAYSNHSCRCMHGCVPNSYACVHNCVSNGHARMCICLCDMGTCVCPYITKSCACMHYYGLNKCAYVRACGENNRALEAKLRGVKTYLFWRF